jgi:hypothetical protein
MQPDTQRRRGNYFDKRMAEHTATAHKTINTRACQDNRTGKPKHILIQDETKMEQTHSDKLQSAEEESKYCTYKFSIVNIN